MKYGTGLPTTDAAYSAACATQQYVWEYIHNNIDSSYTYPARDKWNSAYMSSSKYSTWLSETEGYYNQYHKDVSFNASFTKVTIGETTTLTDKNGVLKDYATFSKNIDGVTFSHTQGSNDLVITADKNCNAKKASFDSASYGYYQLLPNGKSYSRDTMSNFIYFHFTKGSIQNLIFSNYVDPSFFNISAEVESGKIALKKTDSNGTALAGCVFKLYSDEGCTNEIATGTSSSNGNISFEKLKPGTYYIKEISVVSGYLLDNTTQKVVVKSGETAEVSFKNNEPTGKIKISKVSEYGDKIEGTEFTVTAGETIKNVSGSKTHFTKGQVVKVITTDKDGIASLDNLPMGKYLVNESKAVPGYLLNEETFTANLEYKNATTPVVEFEVKGVVNNEPRGEITIIKKDSETGSIPQGDATLENAVYKVYAAEDIYNVAKSKKFYSKGDLVATRTTNDRGEMQKVTDIPLGRYTVKEEVSSNGYLIDNTEYAVNLTYKNSSTKIISTIVTSNEQVKKQQIHIYKSGIKVQSGKVDGLEGAEFTIKLLSNVNKALKASYTYEEIWNGIDEYGNKVNVDSKRVAEAQVIAPTYQTVRTDENGDAYTKELPYGKYICKETLTPKDFFTAEDFTFTISKDTSEIQEVSQKVKDLFVNNEQMETYIKLVKKDADSGKKVTLNSATFQIKATKDIYDRGNGKIVYKKNEVITQKIGSTVYNSFTTNSDNLVVPDGSYTNKKEDKGTVITPLMLPVGSYEISEIQIPTGFLQLDKPITFNIEGLRDYDKDKEGDYIKEVVIKNEQPKGTLIIDKSIALRENVDTSLIDTSDLSGIKFKLVSKEDIIDYSDGSVVYKKGQEIKTYNLDKNGDLKVENLWMGAYELQEIETLPGLVLEDIKYDIKFIQKDTTTKVYTEKRDISNDTTLTEFSKTDITGQDELKGATLEVKDKDGKVVDTWVSGDKKHSIEGLKVGEEYTLVEKIQVEDYVKATDIKFVIENDKTIKTVTMVDKIVEMSKVDVGGEEIEGATIQVKDKDGKIVDEWVSTKEPHKIKNLEEGKSYILHEEIAADSFVKATDIEFTVTLDKETQKLEMVDKIVEMSKVDVGGKEIEGATIQVLDKDTNELVDEWVSEKEPHKIKNLEEGKSYILHEEIVADSFVKATDVEFTVTLDKETQKVEMIDKIVEMSKQDIGGNEIEGAKMQVFDKDGNVVDEWTSEKDVHKIKNLVEGENYKLHEEVCVDGFVKATDVEFKVTTEKENQKIVMIDKVVEITKTDLVTGEELEGAELIVTDEDGNEVDRWISEKTPHKVSGLEEGKKYTLTEITCPYGFEQAESIEFEVSLDKETQKIEMKDMPILKDIRVIKADSNTKEVIKNAKFTFGLYTDKECTKLIMQMDANKEDGTVTFEGLRYGAYYLKELSAPKKYQLSDKIVEIKINDEGVFADGELIEEKDEVYSFTFYDELIPAVNTGIVFDNAILITLMAMSLMGITAGIVVFKKRKKQND